MVSSCNVLFLHSIFCGEKLAIYIFLCNLKAIWTQYLYKMVNFCHMLSIVTQNGTCEGKIWDVYLRDWSWSVGSYGNNTRVICCPVPGGHESTARGMSPPDNKSRGCCCRNSRPTVINPDYNMTKQHCIKRIYHKISSKSSLNWATSPTCLHCDVKHPSLTTGVVVLHIPSWRVGVREEHC